MRTFKISRRFTLIFTLGVWMGSATADAQPERWISLDVGTSVRESPSRFSDPARPRSERPSKVGRVAFRPDAERRKRPVSPSRSSTPVPLAVAASIPVDIVAPFSVTTSALGRRVVDISGPIVCNDQFLGPLPNSDVFVELLVLEGSGGHTHESFPSNRPISRFDPPMGNTGPSGFDYVITYETPETAGVLVASIMCIPPDGFPIFANFTLGIRMEGLQELEDDANYDLVGTESETGMRHARNHFGQPGLLASINSLADAYARNFTGSGLLINDMSLEEGGLFDLNGAWTRPHGSHRFGADVDVEDVPSSRIPALKLMAESAGFSVFVDEGNHYHLRAL